MYFLNGFLLWALPLAAIPIVIHLLNRRRYRRVRWAAMEFLLSAMRRNRKRIRMESWLLLALRTLAVVLLVLIVARPRTSGSLLGGTRTHHVICLDDSASMRQRVGPTSLLDTAERRALDLVAGLVASSQGDALSVMTTSRPDRPLLVGERIGERSLARVRDALLGRPRTDGVTDVAAVLAAADRLFEGEADAARGRLHWIGDVRRVDWLTEDGELKPRIHTGLGALDPHRQRMSLDPLRPRSAENLGVERIRLLDRVAVAGVPLAFEVTVRNFGRERSAPVEVAFEAAGGGRVTRSAPAIAPGEAAAIRFERTFPRAGFHGVTAFLPADRYPPDDRRSMALEVAASSRVLLVDGDPGDRPEEAETRLLSLALAPGGAARSGIEVEVVPEHRLADVDLSAYDSVWLCNVPAPGERVVAALESYVAGGGGLIVFLGEQTDPRAWNEAMWKEGRGLLPAPLIDVEGDADRPQPVSVADRAHPAVAVATELIELECARLVQVARFVRLGEPGRPVRVVLRVGGPEGPPLLLSSPYGERAGEVVLFTTTADDRWINWQGAHTFLILVQQVHRSSARRTDASAHALDPRGRWVAELDAADFRPDVVVAPLEGDGEERTFTAVTIGEGDAPTARWEVPMAELTGFGLFAADFTTRAGDRVRRLFARNAPVEESWLRSMTRGDFERVLPGGLDGRLVVLDRTDGTAELLAMGELWRPLALALLATLLLETLLAWRVGRSSGRRA